MLVNLFLNYLQAKFVYLSLRMILCILFIEAA